MEESANIFSSSKLFNWRGRQWDLSRPSLQAMFNLTACRYITVNTIKGMNTRVYKTHKYRRHKKTLCLGYQSMQLCALQKECRVKQKCIDRIYICQNRTIHAYENSQKSLDFVWTGNSLALTAVNGWTQIYVGKGGWGVSDIGYIVGQFSAIFQTHSHSEVEV